ncbi:MAG: hypothetical protein IT497_00805 [Ottowia sp.]|jgi:predicted exporter|nr:hypothetical protein [Ottowia sp.]
MKTRLNTFFRPDRYWINTLKNMSESVSNNVTIRALIWLFLATLIALSCVWQFSAHIPLQTNLLALLPATERNPVAEQAVDHLSQAIGNRALFLIGHRDPHITEKATRDFASALRKNHTFRQVIANRPAISAEALKQFTAFYLPHRSALLTDTDRDALTHDRLDFEERLWRKLTRPMQLGMTLPLSEDPFGFTDNWLAHLPLKNIKLAPENGFLTTHDADKTWILVSGELPGSAYDNGIQDQVNKTTEAGIKRITQQYPDIEVLRTGAVFYAYAARSQAEYEVKFIGIGSLLGIACLFFLVFRSLRPLIFALLSVAFGMGAATMATLWTYGHMHLITLVFGISLIGEAIDYATQYFTAHLNTGKNWHPLSGLKRITPALAIALATSLLGYGALLFAPFPGLAQIALFASVGLIAAWLSVFLLLPITLVKPNHHQPRQIITWMQRLLAHWQQHLRPRVCLILAIILLILAAPGWWKLYSNDDVRLLVAQSPDLVSQQEKIRTLTGLGNSSQFFLVEGKSPDEVLAAEEILNDRLDQLIVHEQLDSYQSLALFVPSRAQQAKNSALWKEKIADNPALPSLFAHTGLRDTLAQSYLHLPNAPPLTLNSWLATPFSIPFRHLWLGATEHGYASIVLPQGIEDLTSLHDVVADLPTISLVDKTASVTRLLQEYRHWGTGWLFGALFLVYALLSIRYGLRQAFIVFSPALLAMTITLGTLGYMYTPITLFHLMGLILVLGIGVNYAIFLHEGNLNNAHSHALQNIRYARIATTAHATFSTRTNKKICPAITQHRIDLSHRLHSLTKTMPINNKISAQPDPRAATTLTGVFLCACTTLLSFGLLAFSSMPALSYFGLTLLIGVGTTVLLTPMIVGLTKNKAV